LARRVIQESPGLLMVGVFTAIGQSALLVPIALLVRSVFDQHLSRGKADGIVGAGLLILLLYAAAAALGYFSRVAVLRTTTVVTERLRNEVVAKLHVLSQVWHDGQPAGQLHSRVVQDSERFEVMLGDLANPVLPAALVSVPLAVVAFILSPGLFLTVLVVLPFLMLVAQVLSRRTRHRSRRWAASTAAFGADVHRMLRAMTLTKVAGAADQQVSRAHRTTGELSANMRALGAARALEGAVQSALGAVAGSLVLIVGGLAVARDEISLGALLGFYAVLALLLRQLHSVGTGGPNISIGLDAANRLESILETPAEDPYGTGRIALRFTGEVAVENVTFAYADTPVLHDVDLFIAASERVAVLGSNGAGKSTLVSLLIGLYRPQRGRLLADGVPFDDLDMRELRRHVGVVLQDPVLLPGTIRENIAFGHPDASDEQIRAAAATAAAASFVEALPEGYETNLGDEGLGLSGGQRQRIAIARALVGEPRLLLLDEPTTYLDDRAVTSLMANLGSLAYAPTVVVVTHDPHAAKLADRVIELRDGRVASQAEGTRSRNLYF
jgi:ATP-binding cassette subfamily B protein